MFQLARAALFRGVPVSRPCLFGPGTIAAMPARRFGPRNLFHSNSKDGGWMSEETARDVLTYGTGFAIGLCIPNLFIAFVDENLHRKAVARAAKEEAMKEK
ncbi:hypothetical protein AMAG_12524 [Allomyces macrogynus ATCC 38327]|uniref:Uncharacterized protein n=1 Tax=Allomyces macrogynus (strain ATCC 38327) TaxID=578462 RepID=A0A0L0SZ82_ALLM3|nr:hypothetical protein AMAG_12524 [Allomyces macrogynus ATCC 38327]|eukprot:KNE67802.1 hypothetical protein AMAG_12524 [Allomyces macrogynus ATCC 38327]